MTDPRYRVDDRCNTIYRGKRATHYTLYEYNAATDSYALIHTGFAQGHNATDKACIADAMKGD